ncbi:hypothetical protein [Oceanobacillus caeni]|uniref:Uncharacterized protein n=1 Tax=Oceanobacillus caeni TaxID=405946 RepID=A0ABR5MKK0_9BACI|nr:hypothetical protein [Oceanobacillus caeni]KPH76080.1 hypothetical protein AFL42_07210 [Oceanobacillus caeni]
MFNQSGIYKGVPWSVIYKGGRIFELKVGDKVESYSCLYEPVFGIDISDQQEINLKLDKMQGLR